MHKWWGQPGGPSGQGRKGQLLIHSAFVHKCMTCSCFENENKANCVTDCIMQFFFISLWQTLTTAAVFFLERSDKSMLDSLSYHQICLCFDSKSNHAFVKKSWSPFGGPPGRPTTMSMVADFSPAWFCPQVTPICT